MSQGVRQTHYNVRQLIDDLDHDQYAISVPKMSVIMGQIIQLVAIRTFQSLSAAPTNLSLIAGTKDYTLGSSPTAVRQIILNSDGTELFKISLEQLNAMYMQDSTIAATTRGIPRYFALYEINDPATGLETVAKIRVAPTPVAADTLRIYYDIIPSRDTGNFAEHAANTVPLSPPLIAAVENLCAAECITSMDEEDLKRRKLSRAYGQMLAAKAERMIAESNFRQRMLEGQDTVDEVRIY